MPDPDTECLNILYEIRAIVEPEPGKLMQDELVERIRTLVAAQAEYASTLAVIADGRVGSTENFADAHRWCVQAARRALGMRGCKRKEPTDASN